MGGYCAVQYCGGPTMLFKMGRKDAEKESDVSPKNRLPDHHHNNSTDALNKFIRMGLSKQEFVALMGHRTLGFAEGGDKKTGL